jgi:hypothetical protein
MRGTSIAGVIVCALLGGCVVGDEADEATAGASVSSVSSELTGCNGQASSSIPADQTYVITTFGGPGDHQSMSCGGFADGTTWYAASRQRYGCGAKLKIEANGKCVVVKALDYGPDVCVENAVGRPIIDVSPLVTRELFNISGAGWSDRKLVTVTKVDDATPVGRCAGGTTPPPPPPATGCYSSTLARNVDADTCVRSAGDGIWYRCKNGEWIARGNASTCVASYGFCASATLGRSVSARTCVQAASSGSWFQCNGDSWVTPVSTATRTGPLGSCSTWNPL